MTLRQRIPSFGLLACAAVTFTSCAGDPLAKELKKDGFVATVPISTQMAIGDVYRRLPKPADRPVVRMHELFSSAEVEQILKTYGDPVVLPNISGGHDYTISASADLIGKVAADLQLTGARTYSITYGNPVKFTLSDYEWSGKSG